MVKQVNNLEYIKLVSHTWRIGDSPVQVELCSTMYSKQGSNIILFPCIAINEKEKIKHGIQFNEYR